MSSLVISLVSLASALASSAIALSSPVRDSAAAAIRWTRGDWESRLVAGTPRALSTASAGDGGGGSSGVTGGVGTATATGSEARPLPWVDAETLRLENRYR